MACTIALNGELASGSCHHSQRIFARIGTGNVFARMTMGALEVQMENSLRQGPVEATSDTHPQSCRSSVRPAAE
eukprot:5450233-Amphidinium_carterae.2